MGFTEILTIIFIVLKLLGVITWAWWVCLLPEILVEDISGSGVDKYHYEINFLPQYGFTITHND